MQQQVLDLIHSIKTPLPKLVSAALQYLGVKEFPGFSNNPIIMDMAKGLGLQGVYTNDSTQAWCAVFVNHLIRITGKPLQQPKDKYDLMRALKTAKNFDLVPKGEWRMGDIILLSRSGGGHVFIAICESAAGNIIGIGGNQSNAVTFAEFDFDRVVEVRRYYATGMPDAAKRYKLNASGAMGGSEV